MSSELLYLTCALVLFLVAVYGRLLRIDLAAVLLMLSLVVPWRPSEEGPWEGILSVQEGFSGFGSTACVMIVAMFVLSAAMERTGAAAILGRRVLDAASKTQGTLLLGILLVVSLFSAVVSDTTSVLVWMPMVLAVCRERQFPATRFLMPLAFAALLGGQWTLIGTRTNVVVSDFLRTQTGEGLGFLSFTPIALVNWAVVAAFLVLFGHRLLPKGREERSLADRYEVTEYLTEVMATPAAQMVGRTLGELDLGSAKGVRVLGIIRGEERLPPSDWLQIQSGDTFIVQGRISQISAFLALPGIEVKQEMRLKDTTVRSVDLRMVEALVAPNSGLEGRSIESVDFHKRYGLSVLAIGRLGRPLAGRPLSQRLLVGDSVLLVGHEEMIKEMRRDPDVLMLESRDLPVVGRSRAWLLVALLVAMVLCAATRIVDPALAVVLAATGTVLTGCIGMRSAYEAIDWSVVFVLGGMIPFGLALEETGGARGIADWVVAAMGGWGVHAVFGTFLLIVLILTQVIENTAVAIVLAPVGYRIALNSEANPVPFLLGMALVASAGFSSPMAHECPLLVMGPGGYRLRNYLVLGIPAALLTWGVVTLGVPWLFPF